MISPSPTQQPPAPQPEQKKVSSSSNKIRPGQGAGVRRAKNFFRPIIRSLYYIITWIRRHFFLAVILVLVLAGSSYATAYFATRGFDPLHDIAVHDQGSADHIRDWLDALRDGNAAKLNSLQAAMLQTTVVPDPQTLVNTYGQPETGDTWVSIEVAGVHNGVDAGLDSFVEVDLSGPGGGSTVSTILLVHFTTVPAVGGRIFSIDTATPRQPIQVTTG
jgi:hypothetical protein